MPVLYAHDRELAATREGLDDPKHTSEKLKADCTFGSGRKRTDYSPEATESSVLPKAGR